MPIIHKKAAFNRRMLQLFIEYCCDGVFIVMGSNAIFMANLGQKRSIKALMQRRWGMLVIISTIIRLINVLSRFSQAKSVIQWVQAIG